VSFSLVFDVDLSLHVAYSPASIEEPVSAAGIPPQARAGPLSFTPAAFGRGQAASPAGDRGRDTISDGSVAVQRLLGQFGRRLYLESFKDERSIGSSNLNGWWLT
jgi:hypothetical protein